MLNTEAEVTRSFLTGALYPCTTLRSRKQGFLSLAELSKSLEGQSSGGQVLAMMFGREMALWKLCSHG